MKIPVGKYCEIYGNTKENIVMEYLLEAYDSDMAASEIYMLEKISKPKVYQIIDKFIKKGIVIKSRVIGKTQMYKLNTENPIVKIYMRNFKECLNMVSEQYSKKKRPATNSSARVAVNAKSF
jgi:sugar-specific transcriptional regulator TrmB